jgi:hypothetical protein
VPHDVELTLGAGAWTSLLDTHADERALPPVLDANGGVRLKLPPRSALLLGSAL